jgi:hypothetical protein
VMPPKFCNLASGCADSREVALGEHALHLGQEGELRVGGGWRSDCHGYRWVQ